VTDYDVCVVGSANLDLVAETQRHPKPGETVLATSYAEHPGGKGLNQAVSAARSGAEVVFVGALGDDEAGRRLAAVMADDGIDATHARTVEAPTGRALIIVDTSGENSIVVVPGANRAVVVPDRLPPAAVVLAQLEVPLETVTAAFTEARATGATTVLNPAPAAPLPHDLLLLCDVIVPNQHEAELLGGPDALLAAGCGAVIVTLGGDGVDIHTADGVTHVDTPSVDVVDTTGAGDAFCGALSARLAAGAELTDAVRWAAVAGAIATTVRGAVPSQPRAAQIEASLARMA
jgi:ribokinase